MKTVVKRFFLLAIFVVTFFLIIHCGEDSLNAPQDFISGTITFTDANLNYTGGYYAISIFSSVSNLTTRNPVKSDSLAVVISSGRGSAYYKMSGIASGDYYIGTTWIRSSDKAVLGVLGTYGCDTIYSSNCTSYQKVTIPNYAGTGNVSFKSWTDLSKKIY